MRGSNSSTEKLPAVPRNLKGVGLKSPHAMEMDQEGKRS
jgi:hypothetical protein